MRQLAIIFALLLSAPLLARDVPPLTGPIVDEAGLLAPADHMQLSQELRAYFQRSGKQIQVLLINSLQGDSLEDFSMRVAETWKIGAQGQDNGVILLIAKEDRAMRIEVGGGIEGDLTDAEAGRIIDHGIVPRFKQGNYLGGIAVGIQSIAQELGQPAQGELLQKFARQPVRTSFSKGLSTIIILALFIFAPMLISILTMLTGGARMRGRYGRHAPWGGGWVSTGSSGWSGGFSGGGGWSGGGGGFSGGGASGKW